MAGPSSSDPLTYPSPSGDYLGALDEPGAGLRVAFSADLGFAELDADVRAGFAQAIERIADSGAVLVEAHPAPRVAAAVPGSCVAN